MCVCVCEVYSVHEYVCACNLLFPLQLFLQSFENSLSELESLESLRRKVHDKNACLRDVAEQLAEVRTKQMDISSERQQFQDAIRYRYYLLLCNKGTSCTCIYMYM